jgi:ribosomal protein S18 acetylase RimI-like enzyme
MSSWHISLMEQGDIRESARVLVIAMLDNPLHMAVFRGNGESERLEIENMFFELFNTLPGMVFVAKEREKIIGVMRIKSCEGSRVTDTPRESNDENDIGRRKSIWHAEWARHDPVSQHWHLGPIGVLPSHQGLGIGSMLMERFCREVDARRAPAYLETDGDGNVRFYEKFGFRVVAESEIFGVKNRYMLREARISLHRRAG